ncbi:hypothetical protein T11_212 [Trichinella zimbabwensis]|uniref:Uncharacterized protein n=1 Tax=Trichinella zimbabwensis TaxID=268475 RepID=A0A0V1GLJ9_9BILA|nr:hypothetical protein T11_212 [Trichinella zimbabwensis]
MAALLIARVRLINVAITGPGKACKSHCCAMNCTLNFDSWFLMSMGSIRILHYRSWFLFELRFAFALHIAFTCVYQIEEKPS